MAEKNIDSEINAIANQGKKQKKMERW